MSKVWLVAKWEFMKFFKWKQEVIGYLIMLGIYLAIFGVQVWQTSSSQKQFSLGVNNSVGVTFPENYSLTIVDIPDEESEVFTLMREQNFDGVLRYQDERNYQVYIPQQASWHADLREILSDHHRQALLLSLNISEDELETLKDPIKLETVNEAEAELGDSVKVFGLIASSLIAVALFSSFGLCLTSVTTEKMQRVTEQLLTSIAPQQWIDGKTFGICLASLKSIVTTALSIGLVLLGISVFKGEAGFSFDLNPLVVLQILLFIIPGIVMWNYFFVGFSATIDDPNHSGKTGIMMIPAVPVMMVFMLMDDPSGHVATMLSLIPLTSISFMPMRLASMDVPLLQVIVSWVLLIGMTYLMRLFATRIFAANVSLYGKEPGWDEIWRAMLKKRG